MGVMETGVHSALVVLRAGVVNRLEQESVITQSHNTMARIVLGFGPANETRPCNTFYCPSKLQCAARKSGLSLCSPRSD